MEFDKNIIEKILIEDLKNLIGYDTSYPPGRTSEISNYIFRILKDCGYSVSLHENKKGLTNIVAQMGKGSPSLVLNTHLDTVGPGDLGNWENNPFEAVIVGNKIYGLGAANCKGSGAVQLWLAREIAKKGIPKKGQVTFTFVTDEESLDGNGTAFLRDTKAISPDILLFGAPTNNSLIIKERGVLWVEIISYGKSSHAGEPQRGDNAISRMIRICNHIDMTMSFKLENRKYNGMESTFNLGKIEGGKNTNVVPNFCRAEIDRRLLPNEDNNEAFHEIEEVIKNSGEPEGSYKINKLRGTNGFSGKEDLLLVRTISKSYEKITGDTIEFTNAIGVSDGRYFFDDNVEIVNFGPGIGSEGHSNNESIEISSMVDSAIILYDAIGKILVY
ncbi:MAG: ArgE/DapE family deacylase [Flavobacteriaceae bacterium]|jgi:acetylornithine deacetylase/succinyl-diaminopimelate desuccinylase family protein|nr:ArgE/DapE family deacylase [Flavobacteriaceae bacterium]